MDTKLTDNLELHPIVTGKDNGGGVYLLKLAGEPLSFVRAFRFNGVALYQLHDLESLKHNDRTYELWPLLHAALANRERAVKAAAKDLGAVIIDTDDPGQLAEAYAALTLTRTHCELLRREIAAIDAKRNEATKAIPDDFVDDTESPF